MAQLFKRNPPSREISSFLRKNMNDYLSQTESTATMHSIFRFYHEVETAVGMLEKKMWVNRGTKKFDNLLGPKEWLLML